MKAATPRADGHAARTPGAERRRTPRIALPFPATVRARSASGGRFTAETVVDNLSEGGLHLRTADAVEPGSPVFVVFRLSVAAEVAAANVAVRGVVLRSAPVADGGFGLAVAITSHRFL